MRLQSTTAFAASGAAVLALALLAPPAEAGRGHDHHDDGVGRLKTLVELNGPRGVDALGGGKTLVSESDGTFSLVLERKRRHRDPIVVPLGNIPSEFAPAVALGRDGTIYILTGGAPPDAPGGAGGATLFTWHWGDDEPTAFADIAAYQATDPDPYDLEDLPADSNPFGLAPLKDGSVLVADAAGNDLLRVYPDGSIETVARLKPRVVEVPEGLPDAGTEIPSEAVATSVAVGKDYYYVGELRGYPATPGTSQVWKIEKDSVDATCDPEDPWHGDCRRLADGLTSVMDLAADKRHGDVYAVSLSNQSWLAVEGGAPGSEVGALFRISGKHRHHRGGGHGGWHGSRVTELLEGQLVLPGGVDVADHALYLTGPVFGPGALSKVKLHH